MRTLFVLCLRSLAAAALVVITFPLQQGQPASAEGEDYRLVRVIGALADDRLASPLGVAVDAQGNVYVTQDGGNRRIQVFDSQGNFLRKWGSGGSADGQFEGPVAVAMDAQGNVHVADLSNHRIQVFDSQGVFLRKWGSRGPADGQFSLTSDIAVDAQGNVYVADSLNNRVQVFEPNFPVLKSPQAGAPLTSLATTLSWSRPPGTTQYHLQVTPANNDGPGINIIIADPALVSAASFSVQAPAFGKGPYLMLPGMSYSWRIRVTSSTSSIDENSILWGAWSESRKFRAPPPSSTTISAVSPANGITVTSTGPLPLQWSNTATDIFYYEVQVSGDPTFNMDPATGTSFVWQNLVHGGVTNPPNSFLTPELPPNTTIYWRVRPRVQGDGVPVDWSATWSFMTP